MPAGSQGPIERAERTGRVNRRTALGAAVALAACAIVVTSLPTSADVAAAEGAGNDIADRPAAGAEPQAQNPPYRFRRLPPRIPGAIHVAAPPGSRGVIYVVQRNGRIRVYSRGRLQRQAFLDLRRRVSTDGERGMFSVAFHPSFASNRLLYVCYTDRSGAVLVVEHRSAGARVAGDSERLLVRIPHADSSYHNGGQLAFGPDGRLYVSVGDGGYISEPPRLLPDPHGNAQNLRVLLGKIFALDVSQPSPTPEIVAYGLRNPWRFAVDPGQNALVIGDVGWRSTEEIDYLRLGTGRPVNFGWSVYEGRRPRPQAGPLDSSGELAWPLRTYATNVKGNCSVVGGLVYRGSIRALRGRYVFGDYCSGRIWSVRLNGGRPTSFRREPLTVHGLASFGQDARGELHAVSVDFGRVYRLAR